MNNTLLEVTDLCVSYANVDSVKNVSFNLEKNKILVIVGESGSGKSTLLKALAKLLPKSANVKGEIKFFKEGREENSLSLGKEITMIFQQPGNFMNPNKKIGTIFYDYLKTHGIKDKNERLKIQENTMQKVSLVDVPRILNSYPFELSGGMQQRVAIAMAMSLNPVLLLADEPTSALDSTVQKNIIQNLLELKKSTVMSIIMVTHHMGIASMIADYIIVMKEGEIVDLGERSEVLKNPKHPYTKILIDSILSLGDKK